MRRLIVVLLGLASQCCGLPNIEPTDTVYVDARFDPDQAEAILAAAEEWHVATNGRVNLDMRIGTDVGAHNIVRHDALPDDNGKTIKNPGGAAVTIQINTVASLGPAGIKQVAIHELFHGFGFHGHTETGVMRETINPGDQTCIDDGAARDYCEMVGCPDGWRGTCDVSAEQG